MQRVAVIGGVRDETLESCEPDKRGEVIAEAESAFSELGRALAASGFGLLVWSSDERFIEKPIVEGYIAALDQELENAILCVYNQRHPVAFPEQERSLFELKLSPYEDWELGFYDSIRQFADAVILVGGGPTTLVSGVVAASLGKAVFSTPHFHGKAATVHQWLHALRADSVVDAADLSRMSNRWSAETCIESLRDQLKRRQQESPLVVELRREVHQKACCVEDLRNQLQTSVNKADAMSRQLATRGARWKAATALIFATGLFVACTVANDMNWGWPTLVFFVLLGSAGIAGAAAHVVLLQSQIRLRIYETLALGAFSGVFVGLSQAVPQVVSTGTLSAFSVAQVLTASVVAVGAGGGFEHAIDRLRAGAVPSEERAFGGGKA